MRDTIIVPVPTSKVRAGHQDPGDGEHLWTMIASYRISDDTVRKLRDGQDPGPALMDHESLISLDGPGCYKCEQPFSKRLAYRRCTGSMEAQ